MISRLFFTFILFGELLTAQSFTEVINTPFEGIRGSSIAFADIDGDNDQDVLITGGNNSAPRISKLYINDGEGNFTEMQETPFVEVISGSVAFADIDGDEDQDLLITGRDISDIDISKLYKNDGSGHFTEVLDSPFPGISFSSIAFADIDGDNDQDVLLSGRNNTSLITKLYINDGEGNFTELLDTPFESAQFSAVAFSDVDGDEDLDIFITGSNSFGYFSKLYDNDGEGYFTEVSNTPFENVGSGSVAFADIDGDEDQDVFITGSNGFALFSKLYINDGQGNFTEVSDIPFEGVYISSIAFSDVDRDNDQDLLISGQNISSTPISKLYINDGAGNFIEELETPFEGVRLCSIAFSDVDGDNDQDLLITGENTLSDEISKMYINNSVVSSIENEAEGTDFKFTINPNPSSKGQCNISYSSEEGGVLIINIYDLTGALLRQKRELFGIGQQLIGIDLTSLNKGSYIIQLDDGKRKVSQIFLVQ
jgi:hypothetical protein